MTTVIRRLSRTAAILLGLALSASVALSATPLVPAADASSYTFTPLSRFDERLVLHINRTRTAHGMNPLIVAAGTTDVAHGWACHMAAQRILAHNGSLAAQLSSHGSALWTVYAENVGLESSSQGAKALFRSYMKSPEHRANILDPSARFVGIWTKRSNGTRWNTVDFVGSRSSSYDNDYGAPRLSC